MDNKSHGYFNDDGTKFNPNLEPAPALCTTCKKSDDPRQEIPCNFPRHDQSGEERFICFAYESINGRAENEAVLKEMEQYLDRKNR